MRNGYLDQGGNNKCERCQILNMFSFFFNFGEFILFYFIFFVGKLKGFADKLIVGSKRGVNDGG